MSKWKRVSLRSLFHPGPSPLHALVQWHHTYSWQRGYKFKIEKGVLVAYENTKYEEAT